VIIWTSSSYGTFRILDVHSSLATGSLNGTGPAVPGQAQGRLAQGRSRNREASLGSARVSGPHPVSVIGRP